MGDYVILFFLFYCLMYDEPLPVVDHARLNRITKPEEPKRSIMTTLCYVFMFIGVVFIVKRYKDKKSREQSQSLDTLRERDTHLFSSAF